MMHRRALGRLAVSMALMPWLRTPLAAGVAAAPWRSQPFTLGVASGQPRPDGAVLWTRLAPDDEDFFTDTQRKTVAVSYEVYSDDALRRPVTRGDVLTDAQRGYSVHVPLSGLAPDRPYWYRFTSGDAVSATGRTRTAPAPQAAVGRLRLALASCQHYEQGWFTAHRDLAAQDIDLVLFVGDYIYEGSNPRRMVAPAQRRHTGGIPRSLAEYRARYALYRRDPDLQAAHAAHPWLVTWDDHEVVNDYAGGLDPKGGDPQLFLQRRVAAYRAWFEHMPVELPAGQQPGVPMRIHQQLSWGQLADLWMLDCRQYRSPHACPDPLRGGGRILLGCAELADPARTLLGAEQEQWLADGLARSARGWKFVAQSTLINPWGVVTPLGRSAYSDGWDGYPQARERLMTALAAAAGANVVTLGGDVHMAVAADLRRHAGDTASPVIASELVTTSISSRGLSDTVVDGIRQSNADIHHARADERGYTLLDLRAERLEAQFRTTAHPVLPDSRLQRQASFVVQRGRPQVEHG
jgi:alkaline phosphatase D